MEDVIVTAQKREQSLQETPIAISVLSDIQLNQRGISSLSDFIASSVSSLNINPYGNSSSTVVATVRGNGPADISQSARDSGVAVYLDEIYLSRAQGLDFELADMERIEILRGPQGTFYGRNATSGAINFISKRPTGEFGLKQTITRGNYNLKNSKTYINLPTVAGISSKVSYIQTERDGWVKNTDKDESDYNAFNKRGYRISLDATPLDNVSVNYSYTDSDTETTQIYYQFYRDYIGLFGDEIDREKNTRFDIPLYPSETKQKINTLNLSWNISDTIKFTAISAYRKLDDKTRNNYAGTIYYNGAIDAVDLKQEQYSHELRLQGDTDRVKWTAGIYYFEEKINEQARRSFTYDIFGFVTGTPMTPIKPPSTFDIFLNSESLPQIIDIETESIAAYGQLTWTPPVLNNQSEITFGVRRTDENKTGKRPDGDSFQVPEGGETDPSVTFNYHWHDNLSTYIKWSTAHRTGGVNTRAETVAQTYHNEQVKTFEAGLKTKALDNRLTLNSALFKTEYKGMFIDVLTESLAFYETINARNKVDISGAEFDITATPLKGLTVELSYTYLDGSKIPVQTNPYFNNRQERFLLTQTPRHAGALSVNYEFPRFFPGALSVHIDVISTSQYHHWPSGGKGHPDGYTTVNGRINADVETPAGVFNFAVWGKNLSDEEYIIASFNFEDASNIHAFAEPRTVGASVSYLF